MATSGVDVGGVGLNDPPTAASGGGGAGDPGATAAVTVSVPERCPVVGSSELMSQKGHGTTAAPLQGSLRYGVSASTAKRIVCYNRTRAEHFGYFLRTKVHRIQLS